MGAVYSQLGIACPLLSNSKNPGSVKQQRYLLAGASYLREIACRFFIHY